ncbi:hypothetical protein HPB52_006412 [Rhipicephalus sanguineus]|uniref:CCHC-type domain-containing protein n=1 Tax=Rhipicephalus sanguineus TaxID=34632 RepID=A0A9D4PLK9_RHISA|nr:hypothetical protein HPB52_006412 [Rhipicephalus sanguineus]
MASAFLQPPAHFEPGDNPQQAWDDWKEAYNIYEHACEYATKPTPTRTALLLHVLGPHGRRVAQTFPPPPPTTDGEQPTDPVTYLLEQFDALYRPYKNVIQAPAVFNTMKQKENQTFDEFVTDLRKQAEKCDFGEKKDRLIGDRIVVGIRDAALRERLFRERDLTLVQIITTCKAAEISKKHVKELQEPNFEVQALQKPKQWNSQKPATMENRQQKPQLKLQQKCSRCGTTHRPRECPAYGCNCYHCGKFGHFASLCRQGQRGSSTSRQRIGLLEDPQQQDQQQEFFLESLDLHNINCNSEQKQQHKHGDCHTRNLSALIPDQPVWLQLNQKWEKATVVNVGPEPRRYAVKTDTGGIFFRNRVHLRPRNTQHTVAEASPEDYDIAEPSPPIPSQQVEERPRPPQTTRSGRRIKPPARYPSLRSDFT